MLKKLSSALSSKRLRNFIKKGGVPIVEDMNVHQKGTMANQIYSQFAAAPRTNNRVAAQHPLITRQLPPPPAKSTLRNIFNEL